MNMSIDNMCRTCLTSGGNLISIFDRKSSSASSLADMIKAITSVQISCSDELPSKICLLCVSEVNRAYSFRIKCENSDITLRQYFNELQNHKKNLEIKENDNKNIRIEISSLHTENNEITEYDMEHNSNSVDDDDQISAIFEEQDNIDGIVDSGIMKNELNINVEDMHEFSKQDSITKDVVNELYEREKIDGIENTIYVRGGNLEDQSDCDEIQQQQQQNQDEEQEEEHIKDLSMDVDENHIENETNFSDKEDETIILCCADCNKTFDNVQNFEEHSENCLKIECKEDSITRTRSKNKTIKKEPMKCPHCPIDFVHKKNLDKHVNKYHTEKNIKNTNQSKNNDVKKENNQKDRQNCSNLKCTTQEIDIIDIKHNQQFLNTPFKCFNCGAGFANEKSLSFHIKLNKCTEEQYGCLSCKKVFINKESLIQHMKTHTTFQCSKCLKVFSHQDELKAHIDVEHSEDKKNQCQYCNKVFTMPSSLKDHLRTHNGEKPFLCSLCGKAFTQNTNLKQHVMRHTKTKPYKCNQCDYSFVSKGELNSHLRKHTGDHPFVCDICGSDFTTSSSLVKHKRRHTGERPYACEYCPMRFISLGILKNHRRTHTGEKPFVCKFCDRSFAQRSDCVSHMRTHTGERPYICSECGLGFQQSGILKTHMKSIHKIYVKSKNKKDEKFLLSSQRIQQQQNEQQQDEQQQDEQQQDQQKMDSEVDHEALSDSHNFDTSNDFQGEI